ncbi:MAG: response regulator transcription factor [Bacteroidota bacterium]
MKSRSLRIIIADDSSLLRERIKTMATAFPNVEVVGEAGNGKAALQLIGEMNPDLIILDIRLPDMTGIDVLKRIKESGSLARVSMLTNYPFPQYEKRCLSEGADYFYDKNQDLKRITDMIRDLAREHAGTRNE